MVTNEFKTVSSAKQLACYVGVVPFIYQSGSSVKRKSSVSTFANKPLKNLLHMYAISARIHKEEFRKYFERKIAKGKYIMCVLNAIRNKIVQRIYACVTNCRSDKILLEGCMKQTFKTTLWNRYLPSKQALRG